MFRHTFLAAVAGMVLLVGGQATLQAHEPQNPNKPKLKSPAVTQPQRDRLPEPQQRVYGPSQGSFSGPQVQQQRKWKPSIYYGPRRYSYYRYVYPRYYGYSPYVRRYYFYGPTWYYGPYWGPGYYVPPAVFYRAWYYPPVIDHHFHFDFHHDGFHHGGFHHGGFHGGFHHGGFHHGHH